MAGNQAVNASRERELPSSNIPIRTSSLQPGTKGKREAVEQLDDRAERKRRLQARSTELESQISSEERSLAQKSSTTQGFWSSAAKLAELKLQRNKVQKDLALHDFQTDGLGGEGDWITTDAAKNLFASGKVFELRKSASQAQLKDMSTTGPNPTSWGNAWRQIFATSRLGLNMERVTRQRDKKAQSGFRAALIEAGGCGNPAARTTSKWCAITGRYWASVTAAHIFPARGGKDLLHDIFSTDRTELYSKFNGMIMGNTAEKLFDKYLIALVPDLSENASREDVDEWMSNDPKDYKIRLFDQRDPLLDKFVNDAAGDTRTWLELEGQKVHFLTEHRPRSHYLYYHYISCILRRVYSEELTADVRTDIVVRESQKVYWGTVGTYFQTSMLRCFVNQVGHEWKSVFEAAGHYIDENGGDSQGEMLFAASEHVGEAKSGAVDDDEGNDDDAGDSEEE